MSEINFASFLLHGSRDEQLALAIPDPSDGSSAATPQITFSALRQRIARFQDGVKRAGLVPGDRVVMLFPVSIDFYALALALLASGMVLVFLDGRLDRVRFLRVLAAARAQAIVSVPPLLRLWPLLPPLWRLRRFAPDGCFGARPLASLLGEGSEPQVVLLPPERSGLLSFTSGSTGRPKGVDRSHAILLAQHHALKDHAPDRSGEVDMPCFPAVVLHNLISGIPSVLPPMDLRHPGAADPAQILASVQRFGVNSMSGAPAFFTRLCDHLLRDNTPLPSMRRVVIGGAPVSRRLARRLLQAFPAAAGDAVYGSTEAEPMTGVSLQELADTPGEGYLVGKPAPVADLALVDLPEIPPALGPEGLAPHRVPPRPQW